MAAMNVSLPVQISICSAAALDSGFRYAAPE
jgi:hypothetical protein